MKINLENVYKTMYALDETVIKPNSFLSEINYCTNKKHTHNVFDIKSVSKLKKFLIETNLFYYTHHLNEFYYKGKMEEIDLWVKENSAKEELICLTNKKENSKKAKAFCKEAFER